jgi:hypothetical protein
MSKSTIHISCHGFAMKTITLILSWDWHEISLVCHIHALVFHIIFLLGERERETGGIKFNNQTINLSLELHLLFYFDAVCWLYRFCYLSNQWLLSWIICVYEKFYCSEIESDWLFLSIISGHYNKFSFMEDISNCICFSINSGVNVWTVPSVLLPRV